MLNPGFKNTKAENCFSETFGVIQKKSAFFTPVHARFLAETQIVGVMYNSHQIRFIHMNLSYKLVHNFLILTEDNESNNT